MPYRIPIIYHDVYPELTTSVVIGEPYTRNYISLKLYVFSNNIELHNNTNAKIKYIKKQEELRGRKHPPRLIWGEWNSLAARETV